MSTHYSIPLYFLFTLLLFSCSSARELPSEKLESTTFGELEYLLQKEERPIVVFLHADWCQFCKNMEQTTFKTREVIQLLNDSFYFISFDGEQKEAIAFNESIFQFQPSGRSSGVHQLAVELGTIHDVLIYPTISILNSNYEIIFQQNGHLNAKDMTSILQGVQVN